MKADPLNPNVSARICTHMNNDHPDALVELAKSYGGVKSPNKVRMIDLTSTKMQLEVDGKLIKISFDHKLVDSADAHKTLVAMLKKTEATS